MTSFRTYSDLSCLETFEERFDYLSLDGIVGRATFGFDRWLNQQFYTSMQWRSAREEVIVRDAGCDLGIIGYEIRNQLLVHHMNPVTPDDIRDGEDWILDPEFLITTTNRTHNAIHYGDRDSLPQPFVERRSGDTHLW